MIRMTLLLAALTLPGIATAQGSDCPQESAKPALALKARVQSPQRAEKLKKQIAADRQDETQFVGIQDECHVDSRFNGYIRVYINGEYRGTIPPFGDIFPLVGDLPNEVTHLRAVSTCGRFVWSTQVRGRVGNYHWTLNP